MIVNRVTAGEGIPDGKLVDQSVEGDRDAFGVIVSRYQSLISSLAYSATGTLGKSQAPAQETFITAWKHLRLLRERHKLRSWPHPPRRPVLEPQRPRQAQAPRR